MTTQTTTTTLDTSQGQGTPLVGVSDETQTTTLDTSQGQGSPLVGVSDETQTTTLDTSQGQGAPLVGVSDETQTTTLDTSQGQGAPLVGVSDHSTPQENFAENNDDDIDMDTSSSNPLPKPNDKLSAGKISENEFEIAMIADEDDPIFDEAFHNEDYVLQKYWTLLKQILETPCGQRVEAYQSQYIILPSGQQADHNMTQICTNVLG
jgi:hypothetical protein